MVFLKPFSLVLPSKVLQVPGLNSLFILLLSVLAVCSIPGAFAKLPPDSDSSMTFLPFTHLLKKRSSNFLRDGFAVCELPFYEICDKNISRIQCSVLGCCFHKEVCYKKAVPSYMQVFIILILVIMAAFVLFVCHRLVDPLYLAQITGQQLKGHFGDQDLVPSTSQTSCVAKKNRSKRMHPSSEPSVISSGESNEEDMSQE